jgi:hypothetical protein
MGPSSGHVWSVWSAWQDMGNGEEMRERHCMVPECGETEIQTRRKKK